MLLQQSKEDVTSESHQELLDEVYLLPFPCLLQIWAAVNTSDPDSWSDTLSDFTLLDEKDYEKDVVDWVKVFSLAVCLTSSWDSRGKHLRQISEQQVPP